MRVIIIGGGVIGASAALELSGRGVAVTVLEQALPGAGASSKSFGWINASFAETPAYFRLRLAAVAAYGDLGFDPGLCRGGSLWWEDEGEAFEAQVRDLSGRGYDAQVIGRAAFAALEPGVADPPEACIHAPGEAAVDGRALAAAMLARAAEQGARLLVGCRADGLLRDGDRVVGVATSAGEMRADQVVLAAGAATGDLAAMAGVTVPMDNQPGLILHTRPVAPVVRHLILSPDIHFRQEPDGRIVAGEIFSGGAEGLAARGAEAVAGDLMDRLRRRLPGVALDPGQLMLGLRPVPGDGLPVVGAAAPGLYLAVMHSGVTLAPLIGRLIGQEMTGGGLSGLLDAFRPGRFQS